MGIELVAARAWNKPIFAILTDPATAQLPPAMAEIPLYTVGNIDDVIRAIKASGDELSDHDRSVLAELYFEAQTSVDNLALNLEDLHDWVKRFTTMTRKSVPGERLLSELLRMRKQGKLVHGQPASTGRPRKGTA